MSITRDSHYVPQAVLRRWSPDGTNVYTYKALVPHVRVPEWELKSIRGVAVQRDLYTIFEGGQELDDFERWIKAEYEDPGFLAIGKLLSSGRLSPCDWASIARFIAAQDLRTPLNYIEFVKEWSRVMPSMLNECLNDALEELTRLRSQGELPQLVAGPNEIGKLLRIQIDRTVKTDAGETAVRAEVAVGRRLWIAGLRHILRSTADVLCNHRWSIAEPHDDEEWPLTDQPVLRLNYYGPGKYDFGGGWGNPGSEIMMPLSPRHLVYAQVGHKRLNRFQFGLADTRTVQRLLVERAHRWIFTRRPVPWVLQFKPRILSTEAYEAEKNAWQKWHEEQINVEANWSSER